MIIFFCLIVVSTAAVFQCPLMAEELTPLEQLGKSIYLNGIGRDKVTARLGNPPVDVPAAILTCANCHGRDGLGKPEGGVIPPKITWAELTKPYLSIEINGRKRGPYNESRLIRAVAMGIDSSGNELNSTMPRFELSQHDAAALSAYIQRLGIDRDPGLTDTRIRIGTILAPPQHFSARNKAVKAVLTAWSENVNDNGGIYNRRIELRFCDVPDAIEERIPTVRKFIAKERLFAMVAPFMSGIDKGIAALASEEAIPMVGATTLYPQLNFPLNRYIFYLYSGLGGQARGLVDFVHHQETEHSRTLILHGDSDLLRDAAIMLRKRCEELAWSSVELHEVSSNSSDIKGLISDQIEKKTAFLFLLSMGARNAEFIAKAAKSDWYPITLIPGSLTSPKIFKAAKGFEQRIFTAFPIPPTFLTQTGMKEYQDLASKNELPTHHRSTQMAALSAAKLLAVGLRRAGKSVRRERFVDVLEKLYAFETGFTPAVTYGPNRRIGHRNAYVLGVDLKTQSYVNPNNYFKK